MLTLPRPMLSWRRALQFAVDGSIVPEWFATFEGSRYGGENSIDMQEIPRADGSYDFISLSHVLEFVPDDQRAFAELLRVGSECVIVHVTFASGRDLEVSQHFAEPHGRYGRVHSYGRDAGDWLGATAAGMTVVGLWMSDPVTELAEVVHFFCRQRSDARTIAEASEAATPGSTIFVSDER
jgi:Methyltransferase domain